MTLKNGDFVEMLPLNQAFPAATIKKNSQRDCLVRKQASPIRQSAQMSYWAQTRAVCQVHLPGHHQGPAGSENHSPTFSSSSSPSEAVTLEFPPHGEKLKMTGDGLERDGREWSQYDIPAQNGKPLYGI